ncbi:MAG: UDP-N-acetylglucosamine 1-carboxyvinyltransferase [Chloroflexi bacterium]|nr:UDP-N-acetylglucosamine 1-carboxyvinyltransferase [Chloroflexota bacterium]
MVSEFFVVEGGNRLHGELRICGAKNAALPAIAASLLTADDCIIENVPRIEDVGIMGEVLSSLGATMEWLGEGRLRLNARSVRSFTAPSELIIKNRASFMVMGPLLTRFGEAAACPPGGDIIGQRPIDVHLVGFAALGADISRQKEKYIARADHLCGCKIFMDYPSHIGTENLMMAATLAKGTTIIKNASSEPEVVDLASMLNKMGARISGAGTNTVTIEGVEELHGTTHRIIPDRLEAGTFALAAAITDGEVTLHDVECGHLDSLIWKLSEAKVEVEAEGDRLTVRGGGKPDPVNVQALPYPGFATDLQAAFGVFLTQANGVSVIHERVYDSRLLYVTELRKMGARIEVSGQTAVIIGPAPLHGTMVRALDVRSGAALALAGLAASGTTEIADIYHLDRGYEDIEVKLQSLGAQIERVRGSVPAV